MTRKQDLLYKFWLLIVRFTCSLCFSIISNDSTSLVKKLCWVAFGIRSYNWKDNSVVTHQDDEYMPVHLDLAIWKICCWCWNLPKEKMLHYSNIDIINNRTHFNDSTHWHVDHSTRNGDNSTSLVLQAPAMLITGSSQCQLRALVLLT